MEKIKILGIAGSLREKSYNRSILRAAVALVPEGAELRIFDLAGIPLFNQDLEANMPERVRELKAAVKASDAILFATPEYNYSVPGVLKNAIDWGSRPHGDSAWEGKPVGIMSAANGLIGGERAQLHLRQNFVYLNMYQVNRPEVIVSQVVQKLDENGNLTDQHTKDKIHELLVALVDLTRKLTGK